MVYVEPQAKPQRPTSPRVNYQNYSLLPSAPMPEMASQPQSSPFMIDATGLGPQMDPTTIAAGYGRKTRRGVRPNPYSLAASRGYQGGLVMQESPLSEPGGQGGFNGF